MSRHLVRSALELRSSTTPLLPPTFLLPIRARWLSTTDRPTSKTTTPSPSQLPPPSSPPPITSSSSSSSSSRAHPSRKPQAQADPSPPHARRLPPTTAPAQPKGPLPEAVRQLLPLLRAQPGHYATVHIHGRPYLVTPGDSIRLPFLMPGVGPGDVLRLNRATVLGSRDFTLRPAAPGRQPGNASNEPVYVDERLFECRATVIGVDAEPLRVMVKTKRRNRRQQNVKSKHRYTVLRISELKIKAPEEIEE